MYAIFLRTKPIFFSAVPYFLPNNIMFGEKCA